MNDPAGPAVVFVHGPGGIGKTALASGAFDPARVVMIGAGEVEPTPVRLLDHLARILGVVGAATPASIGAAMTTQAVDVIVIDEFERFVVVDAFIRNELLPALPSTATTVLVGRNQPNRAWRTSPGWRSLIAELALGPLTDTDAATLVERRLGNGRQPGLHRRQISEFSVLPGPTAITGGPLGCRTGRAESIDPHRGMRRSSWSG